MTNHDRIVDAIRSSAQNVFSMMLGLELDNGQSCTDTAPPQANEGVLSFVGLAGSWTGTGSLACSAALACRLSAQMLATEFPAVDEEVLDAIAELTNMIIGNVKTDLEEHLGPLGLSIPTVVFGKNFKAKTAGHAEWSVVRFEWEGEPLMVRVCLAPAERPQPFPHFGHTCAVDL
jgi:chemotaxis protein CheX